MSLAREAYEAYCAAAGGKSLVTGDPLPLWDMLPEKIQHAWLMSAAWVAGKVTGCHDWKEPQKDREMDRLRAEVKRLQHERDETAHVVLEHATSFPDQAICRCDVCRHVAQRMDKAGFCERVKDRWWEA